MFVRSGRGAGAEDIEAEAEAGRVATTEGEEEAEVGAEAEEVGAEIGGARAGKRGGFCSSS